MSDQIGEISIYRDRYGGVVIIAISVSFPYSSGVADKHADKVTDSMQRALNETNRRRGLQVAYNELHNITPKTIRKAVTDILAELRGSGDTTAVPKGRRSRPGQRARVDQYKELAPDDLGRLIQVLEEEMAEASAELRFEEAARLRDEVNELKKEFRQSRL